MKKMILAALTALTLLAVPNTAKAEVLTLESLGYDSTPYGKYEYDTDTKTLTITDQKSGITLIEGWDVEHAVWKGTPSYFTTSCMAEVKTSETPLFPRHQCCTSRVSNTISGPLAK